MQCQPIDIKKPTNVSTKQEYTFAANLYKLVLDVLSLTQRYCINLERYSIAKKFNEYIMILGGEYFGIPLHFVMAMHEQCTGRYCFQRELQKYSNANTSIGHSTSISPPCSVIMMIFSNKGNNSLETIINQKIIIWQTQTNKVGNLHETALYIGLRNCEILVGPLI